MHRQAARRFMPMSLLLLAAIPARPATAMSLDHVALVKQQLAAGDKTLAPAMDRLLHQADDAVTAGPWTVTAKTHLPPSKDPKDYVSFGPYWWPDPSKPNGLPYIQRDGQRNPDAAKNSDRDRLENTEQTVTTLGLAYYLTGKPEYARHAALCLRVFFLDPKTGMNPNLNFAQGIPGNVEGRGIGIIDVNSISDMIDAVKLLQDTAPTDIWTDADRTGFHDWCAKFSNWLATSANGHEEVKELNNHGDWFDATSSIFADFLGDHELVKKIVERTEGRIAAQITSEGVLPREMARTRSWHYSMFALQAFAITAERAHRAGIDLWNYQPDKPTAGTLTAAVEHLLHYTETKQPWPKKDIGEFESPTGLYMQVRSVLDPAKNAELIQRLDAAVASEGPSVDAMRGQLIFATIPGK